MIQREFMPEDDDKVDRLDDQVSDILEILEGNRNKRQKGILQRIEDIESRMEVSEKMTKKIFTLLIGIAIGIGVGGVVFGIWTIKDLLTTIK